MKLIFDCKEQGAMFMFPKIGKENILRDGHAWPLGLPGTSLVIFDCW